MAYATPQDMVTRFGQTEMLRLTAPDGQPLDVIDQDRLTLALSDASAVIDSFLRRRYATPLANVPQEITRACCVLARFDLAQGESREPTKQMTDARAEVQKWLRDLFAGTALLADATPAGGQSFGQVQDRGQPVFGDANTPCDLSYPLPAFWTGV